MWAIPLVAAVLLTVAVTSVGLHTLLLLVGLLVVAAVLVVRPRWSVYALFIAAFVTVPSAIPTGTTVAGFNPFFYELLLVPALMYAVAKGRPARMTYLLLAPFAVIVFWLTLRGIYSDAPQKYVIADARQQFEIIAGVIIGSSLAYDRALAANVVRLAKWILWVSLPLCAAGAFDILQLNAREDVATLGNSSSDIAAGATRVVAPTSHLALIAVAVSLALYITNRASGRALIPYVVPSIPIIFFAYSRNNVLAIAAAVLAALLIRPRLGNVLRIAKPAALLGVAVGALLALAAAFPSVPGAAAFREQVDSYSSRVINGLTASARATDQSTQYRLEEDRYLKTDIALAPGAGHGFGHAYRPTFGLATSFSATAGLYYAHNYYYWLLDKGGILAMAAFVLLLLPLLRRRPDDPLYITAASATAAMLAMSVVAPVMEGGAAWFFGLLVGVGWWATQRDRSPAPATVHTTVDRPALVLQPA